MCFNSFKFLQCKINEIHIFLLTDWSTLMAYNAGLPWTIKELPFNYWAQKRGILWCDQPLYLFTAFINFFKPQNLRTFQGLFGSLSRPLLGGYPETWQMRVWIIESHARYASMDNVQCIVPVVQYKCSLMQE